MNEITYPQIIKQVKQLEKQINLLKNNLASYPRTRIDGACYTHDGKHAQECIEHIQYQIGLVKMILG